MGGWAGDARWQACANDVTLLQRCTTPQTNLPSSLHACPCSRSDPRCATLGLAQSGSLALSACSTSSPGPSALAPRSSLEVKKPRLEARPDVGLAPRPDVGLDAALDGLSPARAASHARRASVALGSLCLESWVALGAAAPGRAHTNMQPSAATETSDRPSRDSTRDATRAAWGAWARATTTPVAASTTSRRPATSATASTRALPATATMACMPCLLHTVSMAGIFLHTMPCCMSHTDRRPSAAVTTTSPHGAQATCGCLDAWRLCSTK